MLAVFLLMHLFFCAGEKATSQPISLRTGVKIAAKLDLSRAARPQYPEWSRRFQEQGKVVLEFEINPKGEPILCQISKSSGFSHLDRAAQSAAKSWKFFPATFDGEPISDRIQVTVQFRLQLP